MRGFSRVRTGTLFCQAIILGALLASCSPKEAPSISIATGGVQGSYLEAGQSLARIANQSRTPGSIYFKAEVSSGSIANINAISAGDSQFGIAQADHQYQAVKGLGNWKDKGPQGDLRAVFNIYVESITLVAGADTDIRSISDLRGRRVDIGSQGSGTRRNAIDALRIAGLDWKTDVQAHEESLDDRLAMFMRGELDAFFYTVAHPNQEIEFATFSVRGARIVPLENLDSVDSDDSFFSRVLIPFEAYPKADNRIDIDSLGVNATLLTSANVSADIVYELTKAIFENLDSMAEFDAAFNALMNDKATDDMTAPIHPGALKYFREIGLEIAER